MFDPVGYDRAAQKMEDERKIKEAELKKISDEAEASYATATGFISPQGFAEMGEHDIHSLAKHASLGQIDAVMKSTEWTLDEKREMLGPKFDSYVSEFKELDKKTDAYEADQKELERLFVAGEIRIDVEDGSVIEDATQKIVGGNIDVNGVIK